MTITMGALSAFMAYFIVSIVTTKTFNEIDLVEVLNSQLDRPSREQNCPQEWKYYNGYCYKHVNESVTYSEAKQGCRANDAFVVDIQTSYEAEFLHNNVLPQNWIWVWIGLTNEMEEGVWRLDRTGQIATYTNWYSFWDEPNGGTSDNCAVTGHSDRRMRWRDWSCRDKFQYVCKKAAL